MKMLRKIVAVAVRLLVIAGLFVAFGFIKAERSKQRVHGLDLQVDHSQGSYFIDKMQVAAQLSRSGWGNLEGMLLDSVDLQGIEQAISRNPFVDAAHAYIDIQGRLSIRVTQREPVLRVVNRHLESFYIDRTARIMPVSSEYAADVLVASGNINDRPAPGDSLRTTVLRDLFELNRWLHKNELYKALFVQVFVNARGEYELIPRVGNHTVLLGDLTDLDEKMEKLLALYRTALDAEGWEKYRLVNLKFKDQVICKK
jgi:cell division protein FtsQ